MKKSEMVPRKDEQVKDVHHVQEWRCVKYKYYTQEVLLKR